MSQDDENDTREIGPGEFQKAMRGASITYGPSFQNLTRIFASGYTGQATFKIADTVSQSPGGNEKQDILHPTTLDSIIQVAYTTV